MRHGEWIAILGLVSALGCSQHLHLLERGPTGGASPYTFWPPPRASLTWTGELVAAPNTALSDVAETIATTLREAGYVEQRRYPIGAGYLNGFAIVTRLERIADDGSAPAPERWSPRYPEAATVRWLREASSPTLPHSGRYRVFLIAVSPLPTGERALGHAPRWSDETMMEGVEAPPALPVNRRLGRGAQLHVFVYEYRATRDDGSLVVTSSISPEAHLAATKLRALAR